MNSRNKTSLRSRPTTYDPPKLLPYLLLDFYFLHLVWQHCGGGVVIPLFDDATMATMINCINTTVIYNTRYMFLLSCGYCYCCCCSDCCIDIYISLSHSCKCSIYVYKCVLLHVITAYFIKVVFYIASRIMVCLCYLKIWIWSYVIIWGGNAI